MYCAAYDRLCIAAVALGRPMIADEVARIIQTDPPTAKEFEAINAELGAGKRITDVDIAARVNMPVPFVQALILAMRGDAADAARPATLN